MLNVYNVKKQLFCRCVCLFCVTGLFLFQAVLLTLRPLLSSQLKAQRRSTAGGRGLSVSSSLCSTGLSGSDTISPFILSFFIH